MQSTMLDTHPEDSWLSPGLLRWFCRRHRWLYLLNLALSLTILVWPASRFMLMAFLVSGAAFGGLSAFSSPLGNPTASFLLARPVSRRQVFNTLVLGGLVPWLLLGIAPVIYALIMLFSRTDRQVISYLILVVWTLDIYLFGVYLGVDGNAAQKKTIRFRQFIMAMFVGGLLGVAGGYRINAGLPRALTAYEPALVIIGLVLAVTFYQAGWRLFWNLNL